MIIAKISKILKPNKLNPISRTVIGRSKQNKTSRKNPIGFLFTSSELKKYFIIKFYFSTFSTQSCDQDRYHLSG